MGGAALHSGLVWSCTAAAWAQQAKHAAARNKRDNKRAVLLSVAALAIAGMLQFAYFGFGPGAVSSTVSAPTESPAVQNSALVPKPGVAKARVWSGSMELSGSVLDFQLDGKSAPQATANFIPLAQQ